MSVIHVNLLGANNASVTDLAELANVGDLVYFALPGGGESAAHQVTTVRLAPNNALTSVRIVQVGTLMPGPDGDGDLMTFAVVVANHEAVSA